jgi:WD40 repeat protein
MIAYNNSLAILTMDSLIRMHTRSLARLPVLLVLFCMLVPAGQAIAPLWIVPSSPGVELSAVALSRDGSTIIAGGDQLIVLTPDGKKLWSGWSGTTLDLTGNGSYIVTSQGQTVRLFTREGIKLWDQSMGGTVTAVSIAPDGQRIVAGGGNAVQSWYNSGAGLGRNVTETVHDIRLSLAGDQIIVSTASALRSFNMSYVPNWYDDTISPGAIAIAGDGTRIVTPNGNHIRMYHGSGTLLWDRTFPGGNILSLAYSRDGSTIVAGRDDGSVLVLDREGRTLWTGKAGQWATSVGVSDDGAVIATGSIDNQVRVYDRQGTLLGEYKTQNPVKSRSVAVSGDGSLIVAVDLSNVYGFSRSQFTVPAGTPAGTGNVSAGTADNNVTAAITVTAAETVSPLSVTTSAPVTGTTPSSGVPWVLTLLSLALIIAARKK